MPWQISKQQTSFIYGRRVSDNILLAQELFRDYHRNKGPPRCALKVDLRKAYDNANLEFLLKTMETMRFPECVCTGIQECSLRHLSPSILMENYVVSFRIHGGLRQGDPMSPYLFSLVMEVFSGFMKEVAKNRNFKHHWRCKKVELSTLALLMTYWCLARESWTRFGVLHGRVGLGSVFCKGELDSVNLIRDCLHKFKVYKKVRIIKINSFCKNGPNFNKN
ncbi:hypothetical protein CJ030_MR8G023498 [Morella rubra]|uniref:Reverse transcriptase domain-containing protein n=1 Tax=Morella rubra TaxID=262757 RepID=A0A6A1URZ6_9ROSI|nr:hypothetical protein CJ030_MR8G023498 [Morella rubra]